MGSTTADMLDSAFLFAMPNLAMGVGRIVDIVGTGDEYNESLHPAQADAIAVWLDWHAVGTDIRSAMNTLDEQTAA